MKNRLMEVRNNLASLSVGINDLLSMLMSDIASNQEQIAADAIIELRYKAEQAILVLLIEIQNAALDKVAIQAGATATHPPSAVAVCDEIFAVSRRAQGGRRGENEVANQIIVAGVAPARLSGNHGYDEHWHWYARFKKQGVKAFLKGGSIE